MPDPLPDRDSPIPRDGALDATLALWRDGYRFISRRCDRLGSDAFETRLMLRRVVCLRGREAAALFYGGGLFTRRGAMPPWVLRLLQDRGSVQQLDGAAHRRRKALFMAMMTPDGLDRLEEVAAEEWRAAAAGWAARPSIVLHEAAQDLLCRAACRWAGLALDDGAVARRTREMAAMIDGSGAIGPRNWRGQRLRRRSERWARGVIEDLRSRTEPAVPAPAAAIAWHRDAEGGLLDPESAAVELLNVVRPTVAVARFVTFAALAMHRHPEEAARLRDGEDAAVERFVQEVRRLSPFFPMIGGRARRSVAWRGRALPEGQWVLLDLYGTNRDPAVWRDPDAFRPDRFRDAAVDAFALVPQGGGEFLDDHRCPGEWPTLRLLAQAVRFLARELRYDVPAQDLTVDLSRIPALPASGMVLSGVRTHG